MPSYVDRDELLRSILERVARRSLAYPEHLEPTERGAIEAYAKSAGLTFTAAHAIRRHSARATLTRIAASRAAVDIADAAIAAEHADDALVYRMPDRRSSVRPS